MVLSFPGSFQAGGDSWPHSGAQCLPGRLEGLQGLRCPSLRNPSATTEPGLGGASAEFSGSPGLPILQPLPLSNHTVRDSLSPLVSLITLTASLPGYWVFQTPHATPYSSPPCWFNLEGPFSSHLPSFPPSASSSSALCAERPSGLSTLQSQTAVLVP